MLICLIAQKLKLTLLKQSSIWLRLCNKSNKEKKYSIDGKKCHVMTMHIPGLLLHISRRNVEF